MESAYLRGAKITKSQLDQVKSHGKATLTDGTLSS